MVKYVMAEKLIEEAKELLEITELPCRIELEHNQVIKLNGKAVPVLSNELHTLLLKHYDLPKHVTTLTVDLDYSSVITITYTTFLVEK